MIKTSLPLILIPLVFTACVPQDLTGDTYSRNESGMTQTVHTGVVKSVRFVKLQGGSTAGGLIGTIAGGVIGNQIGGGSGRTLGTLAGAGLGAAAGSAGEQALTNRQGVELTIRMADGETIAIAQEHTERETFQAGDEVKVIYGSGRTRVTHY